MMEDSWEMIGSDPASQLSALAFSSHLLVDQHHLQQEMNGHDDHDVQKTRSWELAHVLLKASACLSYDDDDDDDDDDDACDNYKTQCVSVLLVIASDAMLWGLELLWWPRPSRQPFPQTLAVIRPGATETGGDCRPNLNNLNLKKHASSCSL